MKKFIICSAVAVFLWGIGGVTLLRANEVSTLGVNIGGREPIGTQCLSSSEKNTGKCSKKVDGSGDVCVKSHWYEANDCFAQT